VITLVHEFYVTPAPDGSEGNGYHKATMVIGRREKHPDGIELRGAEYRIDGELVSAEEYRDVLAMLQLASARPA